MLTTTRKSSGFTLVEILVVVMLMGIIIGVGIPNLNRRLNPESIEKAVADMMEACSHARAYAILQSVAVDLVINAEDARISLQPAGSARSTTDASAGFNHAPPSALDDNFIPEPVGGGGPKSDVPGATLNFSGRLPETVAIELMEVNFQDQLEYTEARIRFYPNGTSDEMKMLLYHALSGQRRLISLEVVTALADVEADPNKWR